MQPLHVFQTRFLNVILILSLLLAGVLAVVLAAPLSQKGLAAPAALPGYTQVGIEVRNNDASALPAGYTVSLSLDTAALVSHGQLQSDCDDLRISFTDASEVEIDRLVTGCNTVNTVVQFRTQAAIDPGATDARYALNYNNPGASNPPANPGSVFAFYDDFQDGNADGWTVSKGNWGVVLDGSNYLYRYTGGVGNWPLAYANVPISDLDYLAKIRATDIPKTDFIGLAFRILDDTNFLTFYQARDDPRFKYARITNDSHSIISEPVFTMAADTWYWLRLQAVGSTVRARIWQDGASEPGAWNINTTDTTYQSSPNIGLTLYYHDTNADWDDIQVRRLAAVEPTVSLGTAPWWDNDWGYRQQVTITNTSASAALPVKYTASVTLDTEALINSGLMLNTCDDLRVAYDPGLAATEIDRIVENCNTSETNVWFALQRPIAASGQDKAYYLYYGNAVAGSPPADGMKVFLFFEDWEQGTAHWINAGGLDTGNSGLGTGVMGNSVISTDITAVSSPHTQKYNTYGSGGDAISGYIPVTPSTDYAISVWGWATNTNVCGPVGFDWYNQVGGLGTETWVWTDEWRIGPQWAWHSEDFTTGGTTNFIKLKGEIWNNCSNPGAPPLYFDNMALRYAAASAPTLILGEEEAHAPVITIDNVVEVSDPVTLPNSIQISADIAAAAGTVTSATLRILSPQAVDVPMTLVSGDSTSGAWQASFTPNQGGNYTYRIYAAGSLGRNRLSEQFSFTAIDNTPPVITLVDITNPIPVRNTQTLVVKVTDIGVLSSVTLTTENATHAMSASGDQYSYDWKVHTLGTITYTVTASDTSGNTATLNGSFLVQRREADVCTWMGCRQGAASWSIDDGQTACLTELAAAGIHGTYYFNGNTTQSWFSTYSAAGHEIASHTVGHLCDQPSCFPNCTLDSLMALPVNQAYADSYRTSQIEPNLQAIEAGTGKPVLSLAWPCGCTDPTRMQAAAKTVLGSRGYYDYVAELKWVEDVNNPTPEYFQLLNTAHSYRQDFVDRAFAEGKWSITTSHGLCTGIDYLGQQNTQKKLWVAPVGEVLKYIKVRDASEISNYSRSDPTISFDAIHTLSDFQPITSTLPSLLPIVFDNPVTLQAHILDDDEVLSVTLDGTPVTYTVQTINDMRYVTFDAALKNSRHVEITLAPPSPNISSVAGVPDPLELGGSIQFTANVVPAPGTTLGSVKLQVLSPEPGDHFMTRVGETDSYTASFIPNQVGVYTYRVIAANSQGYSKQSAPASFRVVDTTKPDSRSQSQSRDQISMGDPNTLSAEAQDLGGVVRAILSTDENGNWHDFDWPVDDWWDHNWSYRRPVVLTETAGLARTNELVDIAISSEYFTGLTSCASELRVADQDKVEIPSQVYAEQVNDGVHTCRLLFQATLGANASKTYYIYYGNPAATPPTYTTDLTMTGTSLRTIQNAYFNLDLDTSGDAGVITRLKLRQGMNADLPLSTEDEHYWGLHQVCSSADGNITGKNNWCPGGGGQASDLTAAETISGPLMREITLTSVKTNATYIIAYRFFAGAPYYQYSLSRSGSTAVMNNFWLHDGYFGRLGFGSNDTPPEYFNTYNYISDHLRISSLAEVARGSIDGTNNDGAFLGGTDYNVPTATGLDLYVTTGTDQAAAQGVLGRLGAPLSAALGAVEAAPVTKYGSPIELTPGSGWVPTSFTWQHATLNDQRIQWRIKYVDASGNESVTPSKFFDIGSPTAVTLASFTLVFNNDSAQLNWETASEVGLIGFNLYRSETLDGVKQKLNSGLIPAQHPDQLLGTNYQYTDEVEPGVRYFYWLELVMSDGNELHGPLELTVGYKLYLPLMSH